jgi:hypothetical protein
MSSCCDHRGCVLLVVGWRRESSVSVSFLHARTHLKKKKKICTCYQSCCRNEEVVKFSEFFGALDGVTTEAWLENMAMCFALHDYTSNMKVHMAVFQLKGTALLWWKTLLPQLNMVVEDVLLSPNIGSLPLNWGILD